MNNAILFFFNINTKEVKKINDNYYFNYAYNNYVVQIYNRDIEEAIEIYYLNLELLSNGFIGYEIILTEDNDVLFLYEGVYYILMKFPNIKNRIITYEDVINFNYIPNTMFKKLDKSNWGITWSNKIDFIEYQFDQVRNRYSIIDDSIDYFIGIWENAISYYNDNNINSERCVCHKRVSTNMDLLDFTNPLNFVIDYKERDLGEYLKSFVISKNYSNASLDRMINFSDRDSVVLVISRILFPSYYFDLYEDIILGNKDEHELNDVISKRNNVLYLINYILFRYSNLNITDIEWIKKEVSFH